MITQLFKKQKTLTLERTYPAPRDLVWRTWTEAEHLRNWWGPEKTTVPDCEVDLRIGGELRIVTEATSEMGKYQGTRWPMTGVFTVIDAPTHLVYEARSWTEGEEETSTIEHTNDISIVEVNGSTTVTMNIAITKIGPKAKMASFGMKWGYKAQLDKLGELLAATA